MATRDAPGADPEKVDFDHVSEKVSRPASVNVNDDDSGPDSFGYTPEEQRKIIRHVDRRLVGTVALMYCVSFMDRTNLSAAAIAGMREDLDLLVQNRYSIASLVFFVTYTIFQPPSTIIVRKIGPRIHLAFLTLAWGSVMVGMGFSRNFADLAAMRTLLGVFEAGFFPSCVYLLSTWYTRYEVGKRYSAFYLLGCAASAFSGIIAYGLMQMDGLAGVAGWRWIFIIEGILTCVIGFVGYFFLVDFPDGKRKNWAFLGPREREWIVARVQRDRGDVKTPKFNMRKFFAAGADWKIWAYAMIFLNTATLVYSLAYFLPVILQSNMGFTVGQAQLLVAPPYVLAGIVMWGTAWMGDKYRIRGPIIIINMILAVIGLPIMGFHPNSKVRYFGVFLVTAGANSNIPAVMAYQANNIRGQWKRAFCSATLVGFGGIGGIVGSLIFRQQDSPSYRPGMFTCIGCAMLSMLLVGLLSLDFWYQNRKADRGEKELEINDEDCSPGFRYTI